MVSSPNLESVKHRADLFHGVLPREHAHQKLKQCLVGTFLVRESEKNGTLVLSVKSTQVTVRHYRLDTNNDDFIFIQGKVEDTFKDIDSMIIDYEKRPIQPTEPGTTLKYACPPNPSDSKYVEFNNEPEQPDVLARVVRLSEQKEHRLRSASQYVLVLPSYDYNKFIAFLGNFSFAY
eukprot:m.30052 g.30052  ORF g.30052 m.30052 type:complete len:177 (+) comp8167_c0_seq4:96-626(+)